MALPDNPTYADLIAEFDTYGSMRQPFAFTDTVEEVPLGVFVMTEVNVQESQQGTTMEIVGVDRSFRVQKAQWVAPYVIASGTNLGTAIQLILSDRWPGVEFDFQATALTVPNVVLGLQSGGSGRDPWADAQRLAAAGGFDLFFDGSGVAVLQATTNPSEATPVESYVEGVEAMLLDAQRRISTDNTFNGVVVSGEGTSVRPPVQAVLFDEDPTSPTYRYGPFGDRPVFLSSSLVTSASAAAVVAAAQLSKVKGAEENVDWTQICDPSMDAGDVVYVSNTGTRLSKVLVLDKLQVPLTPREGMRATARTVRVLAGDTSDEAVV
jgi:hypothetical protein